MRIYNGKKSQLQIPLGNGERIVVGPGSISADFLPSTNFLNILVTTFHFDEIALVVNGLTETNLCSSVPASAGFVVYTVAEAVERFANKDEKIPNPTNSAVLEPEKPKVKKAKKKEEPKPEVNPEEEVKPEEN